MIERLIQPKLLWPVPTLHVKLDGAAELNQGLARIVMEKEKEILAKKPAAPVAGAKQGLTNVWQEYNVLLWSHPEVTEFRGHVLAALREFTKLVGDPDHADYEIQAISCWANILRFGDSLEVHHHDPCFVSAHYQVQTGYEEGGSRYPGTMGREDMGHTVYFRPGFLDRSHGGKQNGPMASPWDEDWRISTEPEEGVLFVFPSFVRHEVRPYMGKKERISIAMDVFIKKQQVPMYFAPPRWWVPKKEAPGRRGGA